MEKHSDRTEKQFGNRLLKAAWVFMLLLLPKNIFAQEAAARIFTRADAEKLVLKPKEDIFWTNSEAQFVLKIPGVLPREVQTELPEFPEGVTFSSSRRGDFAEPQGAFGTEIDLWFTFRQTGKITLPPLVLYIQGRRFSVKFQEVEVYENPRTILPRLIVVLDSGLTFTGGEKNIQPVRLPVGKPVRFMLYIQYGIFVQQFTWDIPKDSLFREIRRYEITENLPGSSEFSTKKIPVAYFEWTPLKSGDVFLPEIRMMATSYSGRPVYIALPEIPVQIMQKEKAEEAEPVSSERDSVYAYAFSEPIKSGMEASENSFDVFDCTEIARLREKERRSLLNLRRARAERILQEEKLGIRNSRNESSIYFFALLLALTFVLAVCAAVLFAVNRKFESTFVFVLAILAASVTVFDAGVVFKKHGIVLGGEISPIPEDSALTRSAVTGGNRVLIKDKISGWYYIEYNENGGWIKEENLVEIK